jgi:hypothetical protein
MNIKIDIPSGGNWGVKTAYVEVITEVIYIYPNYTLVKGI